MHPTMNLHLKALSFATSGVIWFVVAITILMEIYETPIKPFLTSLTGHHWVTKGVFAVIVFAALYALFAAFTQDDQEEPSPVYLAIGSAVIGGLTIFLYFVRHFFA
jgi:RsiW-degrading membrane proteinase PrsW (M82 family)